MKTLGINKFPASVEKPVLYCPCCNKYTDNVQKHKSVLIRADKVIKKSKTWKRLVRNSVDRKDSFRGKSVKAKELLFSYVLMECISKKHKLIKYSKPFWVPENAVLVRF